MIENIWATMYNIIFRFVDYNSLPRDLSNDTKFDPPE